MIDEGAAAGTIRITYRLTFGEMYRASLAMSGRSVLGWLVLIIFAGQGLYIASVYARSARAPVVLTVFVILVGLAVLPLMNAVTVFVALRTKRTLPAVCTFTAGPNGISLSDGISSTKVVWSSLHHVVETRRFLLVYFSRLEAVFVPVRAVTEAGQLEELNKLLARNAPGRTRLLKGHDGGNSRRTPTTPTAS